MGQPLDPVLIRSTLVHWASTVSGWAAPKSPMVGGLLELGYVNGLFFRPKFQVISPQNMARNMVLTYLHFGILEFPLTMDLNGLRLRCLLVATFLPLPARKLCKDLFGGQFVKFWWPKTNVGRRCKSIDSCSYADMSFSTTLTSSVFLP